MSIDLPRYFQQTLLRWHRKENRRELPWKEEKDVYRIWLSEIILQQTRVEQGRGYYERFLKAYPTVQQLAAAPLQDVYKLWEGLGYYNRCRNLHATAVHIAKDRGGDFPRDYEGLLALKGVGPYTAAAIASFAYNLPHAVVDGNVFRVLSRFFGIREPIDTSRGKRLFTELAHSCLPRSKAAVYNQAIMDFGATVCKPEAPLCTACPLRKSCAALQTGSVLQLPVKEKQVKQRNRWFLFFITCHKKRFAVEQRTGADVWQHLFQFPLQEFSTEQEMKNFLRQPPPHLPVIFNGLPFRQIAVTKQVVQKLSHQTIHAQAVLLHLPPAMKRPAGYQWTSAEGIKELPMPRILHQLLGRQVLELFDTAFED
jgi:A/G-specific adenine glycosylase